MSRFTFSLTHFFYFALIDLIDPKIPQILINKESLGKFNFDVELLGNSDDIVEELCYRLGEDWVKDVSFSKPCSSQGTYDQT